VNEPSKGGLTRREVIQTTGGIVAASALAGTVVPFVHAAGDSVVRLALVGCGGRGTGAASDAMSSKNGPTRLVAMADVFQNNLESSQKNLKRAFEAKMDVPKDRRFVSFEGYKHAMDCLRPGDIVILATPPAFRWVQFTYAIQKGLNVFMEKPISVDGPSTKKMLKLGEDASAKNLKVAVGLMCRHCDARKQMIDQVRAGKIGDIMLLRAYRMAGHTAKESAPPKPNGITELLHQIRWFHSFLWASGGCYSDFLIHHIDECCWFKDAWPVSAKGSGGREYPNNQHDQNFDTYSIEYTFGDGTKLFLEGRTIPGCIQDFASYIHGTKGSGWISKGGHTPARCRLFKNQKNDHPSRNDILWRYPTDNEPNAYQLEWDDFLAAVKGTRKENEVQGGSYNEVKRGAEASLVTAMGRMAAHTGQEITRDQMLNCEHEFAPDLDKLTFESPAPVQADSQGRYPIPQPGIKRKREY
jgi:predicted dehydrogenase